MREWVGFLLKSNWRLGEACTNRIRETRDVFRQAVHETLLQRLSTRTKPSKCSNIAVSTCIAVRKLERSTVGCACSCFYPSFILLGFSYRYQMYDQMTSYNAQ